MIEFNLDPLRGFDFLEKTQKVSTVVYTGKSLSLNSFYSQGHWSKRSNIKNKFKKIFISLFDINKDLKFMEEFHLIMYCNNRLDVDNNIGIEKVFVDTLKSEGFIKDDSKRYYKSVHIFVDPNLESQTVEFNLYAKK